MNKKKTKTYLFMDHYIYSPDAQEGVFGAEVRIDRIDFGVYFTVLKTGKRGYVADPIWFAENTPENRELVDKAIQAWHRADQMNEQADRLYDLIKMAEL